MRKFMFILTGFVLLLSLVALFVFAQFGRSKGGEGLNDEGTEQVSDSSSPSPSTEEEEPYELPEPDYDAVSMSRRNRLLSYVPSTDFVTSKADKDRVLAAVWEQVYDDSHYTSTDTHLRTLRYMKQQGYTLDREFSVVTRTTSGYTVLLDIYESQDKPHSFFLASVTEDLTSVSLTNFQGTLKLDLPTNDEYEALRQKAREMGQVVD